MHGSRAGRAPARGGVNRPVNSRSIAWEAAAGRVGRARLDSIARAPHGEPAFPPDDGLSRETANQPVGSTRSLAPLRRAGAPSRLIYA